MNKLLLILGMLFVPVVFLGQIKIDIATDNFTTDPQGNVYAIYPSEIKKFNTQGEELFNYSNNVLGEIAHVDASNPMKILVYYPDYAKIVVLDNTLSEWSEQMTINDLNIEETTLVCSSYNNGIWFYNPLKFQLSRIEGEVVTNNSAQLNSILSEDLNPSYLSEYNGKLYLADKNIGVLVFDIYGAYLKTIPLQDFTSMQIKDKYVIYTNIKGEMFVYDFFTLNIEPYGKEQYGDIESVRLEQNNLYLLKSEGQLIIDKLRF